ncbi:large ribosomal subunit protein bL19m-like [Lytechinus pictus]|uniref:large ribosomal subunit protein bL19m-like n=1 Tax=Lytechinus pictus TaxID=7653 RepID=UPI0030B9E2CA
MACFRIFRGRPVLIFQKQSCIGTRIPCSVREINGSKSAYASSDDSGKSDHSPTDANQPEDSTQPTTKPLPSQHAPATTRGPRRKKVGEALQERKYFSPEFMPPMGQRSTLKDFLEREDCYNRREVLDIPEFYQGSILAVTVSDPYAPGKENRFVGICIERKNYGLGASFKLRNCIDDQGIEINYELYNPLIKKIEVIKLEKRLDRNLLYLRDALPEYSTIDPDMTTIKHPPGKPVPVNDVKVKMKPKPWHKRWERYGFQGIDMTEVLSEERIEEGKKWWTPDYEKMDLLNLYRSSSHSNKERAMIKEEFERHVQSLKRKKKSSAGS